MKTAIDLVRTVIFRPYRKGCGPTFCLKIWDDVAQPMSERMRLRYRLSSGRKTIFAGSDFGPSPLHSIDGDDCVKGLMGFLTLRPGDTDADYFRDYTPEQLAFADEHAEALSAEVYSRFGE